MAETMIEVGKLSKTYTSGGLFQRNKAIVKALDDVTIHLEKGKILGVVGESGSGKTTLANVILKLTKATSGYVKINGIDVEHAGRSDMKKLRRNIAVVFQDPMANLNPRFTVAKSIMRPMLIQNVPRKEARQRAEEVMDLVKMDRMYLNSYPRGLSGGQLQRIAIARALVLRPKIMILDEPTSALDISIQAQVLNMLLSIQQKLGLTYIIISHDLNVVRYISDSIAVMYLGKLMEYVPPSVHQGPDGGHADHRSDAAQRTAAAVLRRAGQRNQHWARVPPGAALSLRHGALPSGDAGAFQSGG